MLNSAWYWNVYKSAFSAEWCDQVIEDSYDKGVEDSNFLRGADGANCEVKILDDITLYKEIDEKIKIANNECNWKFDYEFIEPLRFTEYQTGNFYDWHIDGHFSIESIGNQRKHTALIMLSSPNEYSGGSVNILGGLPRNESEWNTELFLEKGDMLIFPACIPYKIGVIDRGLQRVLAGHTVGPAWR